jgi:uncharacterized membrane protein YphA (DoxX/SURF4 family)
MNIEKYSKYSPVVLRIGISLVFLWFGINQIFFPETFLGYLPGWAIKSIQMMHMQIAYVPSSAYFLIYLNGVLEVIFGTFLLLGLFTRVSSLIFSIHLAGIAITLGYNDVSIRDYGLAIAAFCVFLNGSDSISLDNKVKIALKKGIFRLLYLFD